MFPVVTASGQQITIQIGRWGYTFTLSEAKERIYELSKKNRGNHTADEVLTHIAREANRLNLDYRSMTNLQIKNAIEAMEF